MLGRKIYNTCLLLWILRTSRAYRVVQYFCMSNYSYQVLILNVYFLLLIMGHFLIYILLSRRYDRLRVCTTFDEDPFLCTAQKV